MLRDIVIFAIITFVLLTLIAIAPVYLDEQQPIAPWDCIEPVDDIGWATFCEVGDCNVLFYGDDVIMECER